MFKAVIFDMDGLMIDSEPLQSKSYESVLIEYGKKPVYHTNGLIQILGVHGTGNWEILKEKYHLTDSVEKLLEKKNIAYQELIAHTITPMPGLNKLLTYLKKESIPMAVASSSPLTQIEFILNKLGISHYFQAVISGEDVKRGKPHPDVFLEAAKQLQITPEYCVVLEDAESGVIAGKAAGMRVIAVQNKFTLTQDHSKADLVTDSLLKVNKKMLGSI